LQGRLSVQAEYASVTAAIVASRATKAKRPTTSLLLHLGREHLLLFSIIDELYFRGRY
jgi:hypothetical protein